MNKKNRVEPTAPEKKPNSLISIIDDDESIREGLAGLMQWLQFDVAIFASAPEFLASPAVAKSACIVSDVQMPQMTGLELHGHLLATGHDIPMILITAYFSEDAKAHALSSGIVCYLRKPFDTDVLIKCIRSAIATGRT
jgi:FixJ family two-component response regulator